MWHNEPMPKGPQGQKRPADVIGAAVMVARIATGEFKEPLKISGNKDRLKTIRKVLGKKGGNSSAGKLTPEERKMRALKAARERWKNKD